jgi:hypothetical protein
MTAPRSGGELLRVVDKHGKTVAVPSGEQCPAGSRIDVETKRFKASIQTEGYVSGISAGSFLDKKTGAQDLGFGLSIVDFLLEPAREDEPIADGQYEFGPASKVHGDIPKRYVEGPQICTQAKALPASIYRGDAFAAVRLRYSWSQAYAPHAKGGSVWEQTLVFPENERFLLSSDRVTTVAESPSLFLRIDMPGHIKHKEAMGFDHVYLSYHDPAILPSTEFLSDFGPDERYLYRRGRSRRPERFIRAYQVDLGDGQEGPWLAGMTLNADDVYEAWCHQRGYVCLIEEIGGHATKPGDTFGACYLIGWFDNLEAMNAAHDRFKGASGLTLEGLDDRPTGFHTLRIEELLRGKR